MDRYDVGDINDDDDFSDDPEARRAAEARMKIRDRRAARGLPDKGARRKRVPDFMLPSEDTEDSEDEERLFGRRRVRRLHEQIGDDDAGQEEASRILFQFADCHLTLVTSGDAARATLRH